VKVVFWRSNLAQGDLVSWSEVEELGKKAAKSGEQANYTASGEMHAKRLTVASAKS